MEELKDMSFEELVLEYLQSAKQRAEITSRLAELQKENDELAIVNCNVCNDALVDKLRVKEREQQITDLQKGIDALMMDVKRLSNEKHDLTQKVEDLECCGNCKWYYKLLDCENKISIHYCPQWKSDSMTREERGKKWKN
jgi:hypothetical protein